MTTDALTQGWRLFINELLSFVIVQKPWVSLKASTVSGFRERI